MQCQRLDMWPILRWASCNPTSVLLPNKGAVDAITERTTDAVCKNRQRRKKYRMRVGWFEGGRAVRSDSEVIDIEAPYDKYLNIEVNFSYQRNICCNDIHLEG